jgi:hypothetical protein
MIIAVANATTARVDQRRVAATGCVSDTVTVTGDSIHRDHAHRIGRRLRIP